MTVRASLRTVTELRRLDTTEQVAKPRLRRRERKWRSHGTESNKSIACDHMWLHSARCSFAKNLKGLLVALLASLDKSIVCNHIWLHSTPRHFCENLRGLLCLHALRAGKVRAMHVITCGCTPLRLIFAKPPKPSLSCPSRNY